MDEPKIPPSSFFMPTVVYREGNREMVADIFSMLLRKRIIFVEGPIEPTMAAVIAAQLLYLDSEATEEIAMYVQSPGGVITAGLTIVDTMRLLQSPVKTVCMGQCASMAAWILAAGTKGRRQMLPNAEVMIHQPLGGSRGQATDMEIANQHMQDTKKRMLGLMSQFTGQTVERVKADTERDNFMTAEQAKAYGIIDTVLGWRDASAAPPPSIET